MDTAIEQVPSPTKILRRFGIGCLQFRPKDVNTKFDNFDRYAEQLESSLKAIAAFQNVRVTPIKLLDNFSEAMPSPFRLMQDAKFPTFSGRSGIDLSVYLTLDIPERTQRAILDIDDKRNWKGFGKVRAVVGYQYAMPLLFVFLDGVPEPTLPSASTCVRLVREFLKQEMDNNSSCKFTVDFIGPSPFHVEFLLKQAPKMPEPGTWERREQVGYDSATVTIPDSIDNFERQVSHLKLYFLNGLDVFYQITLRRRQIMEAWGACLEKVRSYQEKRRSWGRVRRAASWILDEGETSDLISQLAEFRLKYMDALASINRRISQASLIKQSVVWVDIKESRKQFPKYDIDSLEKLVDFMDRKHMNAQNIGYALFAAISGGAAGALVTWLMSANTSAQ